MAVKDKTKTRRRWQGEKILALALLILLLWPGAALPVAGQEVTILEELDIALWPEYDQEGVLVIFRGRLPSTTAVKVPPWSRSSGWW